MVRNVPVPPEASSRGTVTEERRLEARFWWLVDGVKPPSEGLGSPVGAARVGVEEETASAAMSTEEVLVGNFIANGTRL